MRAFSNPAESLRLLAELDKLAFPDSAFAILHHFEKPQKVSTHRAYCRKLIGENGEFRTDTNRLVQKRLALMLRICEAAKFRNRSPAVFELLARVVLLEIPHEN
jgi:hypothetical protein